MSKLVIDLSGQGGTFVNSITAANIGEIRYRIAPESRTLLTEFALSVALNRFLAPEA